MARCDPVGLRDPRTGHRPWAAVQLRAENTARTLYNLVGFQTNLKWGEQKRVFSMIPGLEHAEFVRYGVMHRNTFLESPKVLTKQQFPGRTPQRVFCRARSPALRAIWRAPPAACWRPARSWPACRDRELPPPPGEHDVRRAAATISPRRNKDFQPMGANMGILPRTEEINAIRDKRRALHWRFRRTHKDAMQRMGGGIQMKILVDAMGGDNAPLCVLQGAAQAAAEFGDGMDARAAGRGRRYPATAPPRTKSTWHHSTIINCTENIDMHDDPVKAVRHKKDSSLVKGLTMLKNGRGATPLSPPVPPVHCMWAPA